MRNPNRNPKCNYRFLPCVMQTEYTFRQIGDYSAEQIFAAYKQIASSNPEMDHEAILDRSLKLLKENPSFLDKVQSFSSAVATWASSGFQTTPQDKFEERLAICRSCDLWVPTAFAGTGKCTKCGCSTMAKLRLPTSSCPLDPPKWTSVDARVLGDEANNQS